MPRESWPRDEEGWGGRGPQPLTSGSPPPSPGSTQQKSPSAFSSFTIRASSTGERSGLSLEASRSLRGKGIQRAAPGAPGCPVGRASD